MKKFICVLLAMTMGAALFCGCGQNDNNPPQSGEENQGVEDGNGGEDEKPVEEYTGWLATDAGKTNLSADGYVRDKISDFDKYSGTDAYRVVTTPEQLFAAITDAKYHYKNVWDDETKTYTQVAADGYTEEQIEGKVHVIEIANDLNLGYYKLSPEAKAYSVVEDFNRKTAVNITRYTMSDMFTENGMSQVKVENTSDLLIYSKNGAKITHGGFKLTSDNNVVFRNLEFDEMWQWEDASNKDASKVGDYDAFGWAYFKIAFCGYVWIDHCTFGKSYDGQIDYSNPVYDADAGTAFRAPYGADGSNGLHISFCKFNSGSDDENGYIYKMMQKIESEYKEGKTNYLYYNKLREGGVQFNDILYGLALPQKKGFLCGDSGDKYEYNLKLNISFANCIFKNLEDRIPKLRGGNAYMYNCIVDSSQYFAYRTKLRSMGAASMVSGVSSGWKCALVSQGIVCGNGGSVQAENCMFSGIDSLLKNNDSGNGGSPQGGYRLINCTYKKGENDASIKGSSTEGTEFPNSSSSSLTGDNFAWHTESGEQPFYPILIGLYKLDSTLKGEYGAGVNSVLQDKLLISNYKVKK